jgi:ABC-type transporter Mla subunit MlaD
MLAVSDRDLDQLIDELRAAIAETSSLTADDRAHLDGLASEVEAAADGDEGVLEQIEDAVSRFETEHAGLVGIINRIANALSAGGI